MRLQIVEWCTIADAGVHSWGGPERIQRGAFENYIEQESMQCLTGYRHPREEGKGSGIGFPVLRLGDQRKDDIKRAGKC